jgi:hypothetical protein
MDVPQVNLTHNDLAFLATVIDGYLKSLLLPYVYPEHSTRHSPKLQELKAKFQAIAKGKRDMPVLLTELDVIALEEAVLGFIRICERGKLSLPGTAITVAQLKEFRQQLAKMKLPEV